MGCPIETSGWFFIIIVINVESDGDGWEEYCKERCFGDIVFLY